MSKSSHGEPIVSKATARPKNIAKSPLTWSDTGKIHELEADLENDGIKLARKRGWLTRKFKSPGRRSDPDRWFARNGIIFWVEFKRLGNEPTEGQWTVIGEMRAAGLDVIWCDGIEDFKAVLLAREAI